MIAIRFLILLLLLGISLTGFAETDSRLLPADEAARDPSLVQFRQQLLNIIEKKDVESLVAILDEDFSVGFRQKSGVKQFLKTWQPEDSTSEFWPVMSQVLSLGGGFVRSNEGVKFCAPYVFTHFPDDLDPFGYVAITSERLPLKSGPSANAQTLAQLSYDLLEVHDWRSVADQNPSESTRWLKVATVSGKQGFVDKKFARSATDYAACFVQAANLQWKFKSLVTSE